MVHSIKRRINIVSRMRKADASLLGRDGEVIDSAIDQRSPESQIELEVMTV